MLENATPKKASITNVGGASASLGRATDIRNYLSEVTNVLASLDVQRIETLIDLLSQAREQDRQVLIFGNGGSAATASHWVADMNKGASYGRGKRFRFICLNDNSATLMAYANDVSYDDVFVEQVKNYLEPGDLVIGISGSGNSKNVLKAIEWANENNGVTIGLCGYSGGKLKEIAQHHVHANVNDMQMSEDVHLMLGHIAMQALCRE